MQIIQNKNMFFKTKKDESETTNFYIFFIYGLVGIFDRNLFKSFPETMQKVCEKSKKVEIL